MISFFIFLFIIILLIFFILGLRFSRIYINIIELGISKRLNKTYLDNIFLEIEIKLFKYIKLIKIKVYKNYFLIFGIKVSNQIFQKKQYYNKINNYINKNLNFLINNIRKVDYKKINLEIESINLNVNLHIKDSILTSIIITSISFIFPFVIKKYMKEITDSNFKYSIVPNYFDIDNYYIKLKVYFDFKFYLFIKEIIKLMNNNKITVNNS